VRRELGGFESAEAWTGASFPYNAVAVLRLSGRPEPDRLEEALAAVQRRQPLLRARLERQGSRWWFAVAESGPIPLRRVERSGDDDWRPVAEEELNSALENGVAPLARCALVASLTDAAASEIVLTFHHAIIDATSAAAVCRQLLELCGGGAAETATSLELPARPEDRFPARFRGLSAIPRVGAFMARQLAEEVGYLWHSRGVRSPPPASASCRVLSVSLGEEVTAGLVRRCRRRRVPLNSALNAALLLAVQRHRYHGRAVPLRYFAFPDLRPYLEPPMDRETVASYLTTMRFTHRLGTGESLWGLASRIDRQLYRSFRRGEKFLFCMTSAGLLRMVIRFGRIRFGTVAVAYNGPLAFPEACGELRLRSIHGFVSNMPIGAELTGQALLLRGRLWWDFVYLDADMDETGARTIVADISRYLEEAADERD
jgi:hypothetical protein